jgi:hypothetical protein
MTHIAHKRNDYLVLDEQAILLDARSGSDECLISRESLDAARKLLECIDMRKNYRLENSCVQHSDLMASRSNEPKIHSLSHLEREQKPLDDAAFAPAPPPRDRITVCFTGGCAIRSHPDDPTQDADKNALDETSGVFLVRETYPESGTCILMKAPVKLERFISNVSDIMLHAQPGACNDFATARLALLDLEFSRYK